MPETGPSIVGINLRRFRKRLGMTQEELADAVGTKQGYITQIEKGKTQYPSADLLRRFASALRVTLESFWESEGPPAAAELHPVLREFLESNAAPDITPEEIQGLQQAVILLKGEPTIRTFLYALDFLRSSKTDTEVST